jgi:hypothetical protein
MKKNTKTLLKKTMCIFSHHINRKIKSRRMRWVGHVACIEEWINVYMVLVGKPKGKEPLG